MIHHSCSAANCTMLLTANPQNLTPRRTEFIQMDILVLILLLVLAMSRGIIVVFPNKVVEPVCTLCYKKQVVEGGL